jgi:DNA-binding transcriptional LysR family regulator
MEPQAHFTCDLAVLRASSSAETLWFSTLGVDRARGEAIERDMVQMRLTEPFRFVVVGSPDYLARHGTPERPEDLLRHECITFRSRTTGALYAWELERGRRNWVSDARNPSREPILKIARCRRDPRAPLVTAQRSSRVTARPSG